MSSNDEWNGLSRLSVEWMQGQIKVLENLYSPNQDLDLIGLSDMLRDEIYNVKTTAELSIERYMRSLIALVISRDKIFVRYYKIDARNAMYSVENSFYHDKEYLKKVIDDQLQELYEDAIRSYRSNVFEEEDVDVDKMELLPKKVPWSINDLLDKGVTELALILTEAMSKNI